MKKFLEEYLVSLVAIAIGGFFLFAIPADKISNRKSELSKIAPVSKVVEDTNKDNTLLLKSNFDNVSYYLYLENNNYKSYFIDEKENKISDITLIIKKDKIVDFENKINELLQLKYPKFIVDAINKNSIKNYEIKDNEMIIYYSGVDLELQNSLSLKVNYNEVKDYLNITVKLDKEYENEDGFKYDPTKKTIAFSYDDGPNGESTLTLVNALKENKAHATFYMVGNRMDYYSTVVSTVYNSGNEIGSHSYSHYSLARAKPDKIQENEAKTNEIYYNITNDTFKTMRPPYGAINERAKNALDIVYITWSVDTEDWKYRDKDHIVNEILNNVEDGDIVLMHDLYDTTVQASIEVLPILYARGYQVVSVSELAALKGKTLEAHNVYRSFKS